MASSTTRSDFLKLVCLGVTLLILAGCTSPPLGHGKVNKPFTIIALPDTQYYSRDFPHIFLDQTKWIVENKDRLNIVCVVHEGDIVQMDGNNESQYESEWQSADKAMSLLDDVVPYCMVVGNHDMPADLERDTESFNQYFGVSRFEDRSWYGGNFENKSDNAFYFPDVGGMKLMVLCLEMTARDEVLEWANQIVEDHNSYKTIVVTHCYMSPDGTRVKSPDDDKALDIWVRNGLGNDGEQIWNKFVRKHENIILVLCGHLWETARLTSYSDHGTKVNQILANYQMRRWDGKGKICGNGWLRVMKFIPLENRIEFSTYSPTLDRYLTDNENQFVLKDALY